MNPQQAAKHNATLKEVCLGWIREHPGVRAIQLPPHLRRFLRELERQDGLIYYDERDEGWRVKSGIA